MKHLFIVAILFLGTHVMASTSAPTVNDKALKTFNEVFKQAENVQWTTHKNIYEAVFEMAKIQTRAFLDNDGKLLRTIRYYAEDGLPASILYNLKERYCHGEQIWGVTEISARGITNYHVTLKCKKYWLKVLVDPQGETSVISKMRRADI